MSKLGEYLKLIPRGIANIEKVVEGHINNVLLEYGSLPEAEREEIIKRRVICAGCPYMSVNAKEKGYKSERVDEHCTMCGCPIEPKTASLDSNCGIEHYNKKNPNNRLPLKWTKFDP